MGAPNDDLEFNPYEAPTVEWQARKGLQDKAGVWRDGRLLVLSREATLPERCLKCNRSSNVTLLPRKLSWHSEVIYLLLFLNIFLYIIVALIVRKTARVVFPLCERHHRRRRRTLALGWGLVLLGVVAVAGASVVVVSIPDARLQGAGVPVLLGGVLVIFAGVLSLFVGSQIPVAKRIDTQFVWLKNVHPAYLQELPLWTP